MISKLFDVRVSCGPIATQYYFFYDKSERDIVRWLTRDSRRHGLIRQTLTQTYRMIDDKTGSLIRSRPSFLTPIGTLPIDELWNLFVWFRIGITQPYPDKRIKRKIERLLEIQPGTWNGWDNLDNEEKVYFRLKDVHLRMIWPFEELEPGIWCSRVGDYNK